MTPHQTPDLSRLTADQIEAAIAGAFRAVFARLYGAKP